ncbi:MAG: hypothetical protein WCQ75_00765 [Bacilli bacterium]
MSIRYTVTTSSCPHCGHVLKRESDFSILWILLMLGTCFTALFWVIAIAILKSIFKYDGIKMGSPFIKCPNCNKTVKTGEAYEWGSINKEYKRNWAFRNWMRFAYFLGGLALLSLIVVIGSAINGKPADTAPLVIFLIICIISVLSICGIYYKRKKNLEEDYITVSETDYDLIKESWTRLHNIEPLAYETETIKISGTEKIIKPKIPKEEPIKNSNEKEKIETKKIERVERVEDNKEQTEAPKTAKASSTAKKPQTKHVIVAKKNIKKD